MATTAPTTAEVAAWVPTRTTVLGNRQNDFTADTEPTGDQVDILAAAAASHVDSQIGDITECSEYQNLGEPTAVAALYTAMLVELTYFPEQVGTNRSPYAQLKELWDERLEQLREAIEEICGDVPGDTGEEGEGGGFQTPAWYFDSPLTPLGKRSVW